MYHFTSYDFEKLVLWFVLNYFQQPQQKVFNCIKNGENGETMSAQHSNESLAVQTPAGTIGDCQIYSTNNSASNIASVSPISPPALNRNGNINGGVVDVIQRQTAWPTAITTTDQQNDGNGNDDEGKHGNCFKQHYENILSDVLV